MVRVAGEEDEFGSRDDSGLHSSVTSGRHGVCLAAS